MEYFSRVLFYSLRSNIKHGIDNPKSALNMQDLLPYEIEEVLRNGGIDESDVYDIFAQGVENVARNPLPPIYKTNAHVLREGHVIL